MNSISRHLKGLLKCTIKAHGMENKPPSLINQPRQKTQFLWSIFIWYIYIHIWIDKRKFPKHISDAFKVSCNTDITTISCHQCSLQNKPSQPQDKNNTTGGFLLDKSGSYTSGFASETKRGWPLHMERERK